MQLITIALALIAADAPIGARVDSLEFKDIRYQNRSLDDFGAKKAVVFVATSVACPLARQYLPVLRDLEKTYRPRGVQFVALNVAASDSIVEMAAQAVLSGAEFPFVKDVDGSCAASLGLKRTPEVVVLDADRVIRYRGRIDDQLRVGGGKPSASRPDLKLALDEILAGKAVSVSTTPVDGCKISDRVIPPRDKPPTFFEQVEPIVQKHCQDCHHDRGTAPFQLVSYADVAAQGETIAEVVAERRMPPWHASEQFGAFTNARKLSADEVETLVSWVRGGMPKGDAANRPPARQFDHSAWRIDGPDLVIKTAETHTIPATGFVDYRYSILPHVFLRDTWVEQIEINPDNPKVVHHSNLAFMKLGGKFSSENFLTGRVPGGDPMRLDPGTAVLIPAGSVLALQIHYTTTGREEKSRIAVGLRFPRSRIQQRLYHKQVHTSRFAIPPGAPAHEVKAARVLEADATGVGMFSHMHVRGRDMTFSARRPDSTETLLLVPNYQFDWQQSYRWKPGAMRFPKDTVLEVVAHFDNSKFNPFNPDPSATVGHGDQTFDEMMYGFVFYTRDGEDLKLDVDPKSGNVRK